MCANKNSAKRSRRERDRRRADAEIEVCGILKDKAVLRIRNKTREGILLYLFSKLIITFSLFQISARVIKNKVKLISII